MMQRGTHTTDGLSIPDISDQSGRFAVVVEGRVERRCHMRTKAEEYVSELDQHHTAGRIVDTE